MVGNTLHEVFLGALVAFLYPMVPLLALSGSYLKRRLYLGKTRGVLLCTFTRSWLIHLLQALPRLYPGVMRPLYTTAMGEKKL